MAIVALMALCGVMFLAYALSPAEAANRDFVCYWTSGRLLLKHANPYDPAAVLQLERSVGFTGDRAFLMRNPPTLLIATVPLGLLPERTAAIVWLIALCGAFVLSVKALEKLNGGAEDRFHLTGYLFPPAIACLFSGQIGLFLLLGAVLFLLAVPRRPFLAGLSLAVFAVKPHLAVPFFVVLMLWSLRERRWRILWGAMCGTGVLLLAGLAADPHGWAHYATMIQSEAIGGEFVPSPGFALREFVAPARVWVQAVPCVIGSLWALWHYWGRREDWNWVEEAPFLFLVSVTVSPYSWFTDQSLALPAVAISLHRQSSSSKVRAVFALVAAVGILTVFSHDQLNAPVFLLLSPLWLGFCIYARHVEKRAPMMSPPTPVEGLAKEWD